MQSSSPGYGRSLEMQSIDLIQTGEDVVAKVSAILNGNESALESSTQAWALTLNEAIVDSEIHSDLTTAIQDCLIDILSCDGEHWDTSRRAFAENLSLLQEALLAARRT